MHKGGCRLKKKSAVILVIAVVLILASVIVFSVLNNDRDPKPGGPSAVTDKDVDASPQPSNDTEDAKTPGEDNDQASGQSGPQDIDTDETENGSEDSAETVIITPEDAKTIISATADIVIRAIADKDFDTVSEYTHPKLGVRFTPYTHVSVEDDLVFNKDALKGFMNDSNVYHWGYYDGSGEDIRLTPAEYYEKFIYPADYVNAPQIGYNEVMSFGNMLENQFEVYKGAIIVEYYFPGFDPQFGGADWRSLRLVFQKYNDSWKLTGLISNQWTT